MLSRITKKFLDLPVSEWSAAFDKKLPDLHEMEQELSFAIQRMGLLHAYLDHRYLSGCGDRGHAAAARKANSQLTKIRRAIGYTYPESGLRIPR